MTIRPYHPGDHAEWARMRTAFWPDQTAEDMAAWLARPDAVVLVAERPGGGLCGFAEVGTRPFADGCQTSPVAYLEGWWVDPDARRNHVGTALVEAAFAWAHAQGHREIASDANLDNTVSQLGHRKLGFSEEHRSVHYRRALALLPLLLALAGTASAQQVADTAFRPVVGEPAYPAGKGPLVLIDEAHQNFHTSTGRYLPFARVLRHDGYQVGSNIAGFTAASLAGAQVLVIANAVGARNVDRWIAPIDPAFSNAEIRAVHKWVEDGGSLLLIADHMPFGEATAALAHAFGITLLAGFAADSATTNSDFTFRRGDGTLADDPITRGRSAAERIDSVRSFTGEVLTLEKGTGLLRVLGTVMVMHPDTAWQFHATTRREFVRDPWQGAILEVGKGRVAVFGEAAMFSAQVAGPNRTPAGMNDPRAGQNAQFLLNVMHWLTGPR